MVAAAAIGLYRGAGFLDGAVHRCLEVIVLSTVTSPQVRSGVRS